MISVCGPNEAAAEERELAEQTGREIARTRAMPWFAAAVGGVMGAACYGAKSAGGVTIGILPGYERSDANRYVDHPICTGLGHARNVLVVASGQAVIAIGGGFGTLSEIGLALKMGKRVIHLGSWDLDHARMTRFAEPGAEYLAARDPDHAVELACEALDNADAGAGRAH